MMSLLYVLAGIAASLISQSLPPAPSTLLQSTALLLSTYGLLHKYQPWPLPLLVGTAVGIELFGTRPFGQLFWFSLCIYLATRITLEIGVISRSVKVAVVSLVQIIAFALLSHTLRLSASYVLLLTALWGITLALSYLQSTRTRSIGYEIA